MPIESAMLISILTDHGKILADYLATGASQDFVFMKGIDRPVATGLLAGIKGLRRRT
jgi:hypothetical protein